jgi:hypothetical protein
MLRPDNVGLSIDVIRFRLLSCPIPKKNPHPDKLTHPNEGLTLA